MKEQVRAEIVEEAITFLNAADSPLAEYGGGILFNTTEFIHGAIDLREQLGFPPEVTLEELDRLDGVAVCGGGKDGFELLRQSPLGIKKLEFFRRLGRVAGYPRACTIDFANVQASGKVVRKSLPFVYETRLRGWRCLTTAHKPTGRTKYRVKANGFYEHREDAVQGDEYSWPIVGTIASWIRRWLWQIELAPGTGGVPVALTTDPVGVRAWFKMRDVPEGMTRRAALLHWVREHWRQNRHDPETELHVREHLRGRTTFDWFGMVGTVIPSEPDQVRAEASKRAKEAMSKAERRRKLGMR
jgi:hypothetical protein